jgi:hypothetical protein
MIVFIKASEIVSRHRIPHIFPIERILSMQVTTIFSSSKSASNWEKIPKKLLHVASRRFLI